MDPMLGMIFMVPWNWAPNNYQLCQGQTVNLQQYEALYSLMGTVFGGNGSTTFMLPNLQGRAPVGTGQSPQGTYYTLAAFGGSEVTTLSATNLPVHNHQASFTPVLGSQVVSIPATTGNLGVTANVAVNATAVANTTPTGSVTDGQTVYPTNAGVFSGPTNVLKGLYTATAPAAGSRGTIPVSTSISGTASTAANNVTINAVTNGAVAIGTAGGSAPFSTMQPFLAMSFIIAMNGLYPDRP